MKVNLSSKNKLLAKKLLLIIFGLLICFIVVQLKTKGINLAINSAQSEDKVGLSRISIYLNQDDYAFLFSNIPLSLRAYQDCKVVADNKPLPYKAALRVRGNHAWHWYKEKPSLRIRFENDSYLYGRKYIDLVNPEDPSSISNVLSCMIAKSIGLAHFNISFAQVFINNEYKGLYHIADAISPNMLQSKEEDKGPLIIGNDWNLKIWKDSKIWEIESESFNYDAEELDSNLKRMLENFSRPISANAIPKIWNYLDFDKTVLWSAFMTIIGSLHTDDFHNNFYVYNNRNKNFYPVNTDPAGFGVLTAISGKNATESFEIPIYEFLTPMHDLAFRDNLFVTARNKKIHELLSSEMSLEVIEDKIEELNALISPLYNKEAHAGAVITVPNLYFPMRLPISEKTKSDDINRLRHYYRERVSFLNKELAKCEVVVNPVSLKSETISFFAIRVKGNAPVVWTLKNMEVYLDINLDKNLSVGEVGRLNELVLYPALKKKNAEFSETNWLMINKRLAKYQLDLDYQSYLIGVNKSNQNLFLDLLKNSGKNAINKKKVDFRLEPEDFSVDNLYINSESLHPWKRGDFNDKI